MIKAEIIGGAGYTAGELIRILLNHPEVELSNIQSSSQEGKPIYGIHSDLIGDCNLTFSDSLSGDADVVFLCSGHGKSKNALNNNLIDDQVNVIDLSNDFRLKKDANFQGRQFVYGLPEFQSEKIIDSKSIANPGCFATAIQLAMLPLFNEKIVENPIHIHAITGSTGAGQSLSSTTHFTWRNNNVSIYKPFTHQHLDEIGETWTSLQPDFGSEINFIPVRGNFTRGIFASVYTEIDQSLINIEEMYRDYYKKATFTHISDSPLHLKQVVNTNKCLLHVEKHGNKLLVTSMIDNLLKGASGQAVENMNLMFGLPASTGLKLKSIAF